MIQPVASENRFRHEFQAGENQVVAQFGFQQDGGYPPSGVDFGHEEASKEGRPSQEAKASQTETARGRESSRRADRQRGDRKGLGFKNCLKLIEKLDMLIRLKRGF
jgi:hypothetical protein